MQEVMLHIIFGDKWCWQTAYKVLALVMLFVGGLAAYTFVWDLGDVGDRFDDDLQYYFALSAWRGSIGRIKEIRKREKDGENIWSL